MVAGYVEIVLRFRSSGLLRRNLLRRVLKRPGAEEMPYSAGETISRFRDDAYQGEDNLDWTDEIVAQGAVALVALGALLLVSVPLTLAAVVPVLVIVAIAQRASVSLVRRREISSQAASEVTGAIGDIFAAVQTVQTAGAEARMTAHVRRLGERRRAAMLIDRVANQALEAVTTNTANIGTGLIMLLGAGGLREGTLTVGDFVLFVSYTGIVAVIRLGARSVSGAHPAGRGGVRPDGHGDWRCPRGRPDRGDTALSEGGTPRDIGDAEH